MYILSQNKKTLMEFERIEVVKNFGGKKDEKYILSTWGRALTNPISLGNYPTEEDAVQELEKIVAAVKANAPLYEVK